MLQRWEPEKGAHGSSWGSFGSENECEQDCVDDVEARGEVRVREAKYDRQRWWLQPWDEDQFCAHCRKEKRTPSW